MDEDYNVFVSLQVDTEVAMAAAGETVVMITTTRAAMVVAMVVTTTTRVDMEAVDMEAMTITIRAAMAKEDTVAAVAMVSAYFAFCSRSASVACVRWRLTFQVVQRVLALLSFL